MKVNINGVSYEYGSDYPAGWASNSVDFFKFPVMIGNHPCFIKRFEKQDPASISGWELLVRLENEPENNLSRIYDIKSVEEKGKRIYYVFYQCLTGNSIDKLISNNIPIDLTRLTKDLFQAIASLQKHNFWYADFFEKNIILEDSGRFVLVDLDSAQPVSKHPADNMWGSRNYWAPVFDFYTKILEYKGLKVADLSGLSLNHLQIIFLILRLKILYLTQQEPTGYQDTLDNLHTKLDEIAPSFKELFIKVYNERKNPRHLENAAEIERLINQKIINYKSGSPSAQIPVIFAFTANTYLVGRGESFELRWDVKNASYVELYKNGAFDERFTKGETSAKRAAFYDGGSETVLYKLVAYNEDAEMESSPVEIRFREQAPDSVDFKIETFTANPDLVNYRESFELSWEVKDADYVELYKNGVFDEKFTQLETKIKKTAFYDKGETTISYKLVAYRNNEKIESSPVDIRLRERVPTPPPGTGKDKKIVELIPEAEDAPVFESPIIDFAINNYIERDEDSYVVESGKPFNLTWKVNNANEIQIQKDGQYLKSVSSAEKSIALTENIDDGEERKINYTLSVLITGTSKVDSRTLQIIVKPARPVINLFKTSKHVLRNGGSYILSWDVQNATDIELYRDELLYKAFIKGEKNIELTEKYTGIKREIKYTLQASNGFGKASSQALSIFIKPPVPLKIIFVAIAVLVLLVSLYNIIPPIVNKGDIGFGPFNHDIKAGETITIPGKNLPENSKIVELKFNGVKGEILQLKKDSIRVKVPELKEKYAYVTILAYIKGKEYQVAQHVSYGNKEISPPSGKARLQPFSGSKIARNQIITIRGENLPTGNDAIQIKFNGVEATVVQRTRDSIRVSVPLLKDNWVDINARMDGIDVPLGSHIQYQRKPGGDERLPRIFQLSDLAVEERKTVTIYGENLPMGKANVEVTFNTEPGTIISQSTKTLKVVVPRVPGQINNVSISVIVDGRVLKTFDNISYTYAKDEPPVISTTVDRLGDDIVVESHYIQIFGENFPLRRGAVVVKFNNVQAEINQQNLGVLRVQVPTVPGGINRVNISVIVHGQVLKVFNNINYQLSDAHKN